VNTVRAGIKARIVSFNAANTIRINGNIATGDGCSSGTLNAAESCTVSGVNLGDVITSDYPIEAHAVIPGATATSEYSYMDLSPGRTAGKEFAWANIRTNPTRVTVCALDKATTVTWSCNNCGYEGATSSIAAGTCTNKEGNYNDGSDHNDPSPTASLSSTELVVVSYQAAANQDHATDFHVLVPATSGTLYGIVSNWADVNLFCSDTTSFPNGQTVNVKVQCRGAAAQTKTVQCGTSLLLAGDGNYNSAPCTITATTAGAKIAVSSTADGNGGDATVWLRATDFRKEFFLPGGTQNAKGSEYLAIVSSQAGTVTIGGAAKNLVCGTGASDTGVCGYWTNGPGGWNAGTQITASVPIGVVGQTSMDDETNFWGHASTTFQTV
jgi:hypothetical protein